MQKTFLKLFLFIIFCFGFFVFWNHSALAMACPYTTEGTITANVSGTPDSIIIQNGKITGGECSYGCIFMPGSYEGRAAYADPLERLQYFILGTSVDGYLTKDQQWWLTMGATPTYCLRSDTFRDTYMPYGYVIDATISDNPDYQNLPGGNYTLVLRAIYDPYAPSQIFEQQFGFTKTYRHENCCDNWGWNNVKRCGGCCGTAENCVGYDASAPYYWHRSYELWKCDYADNQNSIYHFYEDCGEPYWSNDYQCSGTMRQRKYVSRGCSGGSCYSNEIWYNWEQCGSDYWGDSYTCSGSMVQRLYYSRGCSGGSCYSNPSWQNWQECGGDYWTNEYRCSGTMRQRKYVSRGCSGGSCYSNEIWYNWEQCGSDYWTNNYQCSGTIVQRQIQYQGCASGSCYSFPAWINQTECGGDYWTNDYRCSGTMRQRKYVSRGCSGGSCYSNEIWYNWQDCGSDYWGSNYSCSGNWRTREYISRGCSGSSCYSNTYYYNWENCDAYDGWYGPEYRDYYCSSGSCVYIGNTKPNIPTLIAPPHNTWINYNPTFQATVSDPDGEKVKAYFNVSGYGDGWGNLVNSGQTSSWGAVAISDGEYWWRAYAQDIRGLNSDWSGYWLLRKDIINPLASIDQENGVSPDASIWVNLTESDERSGIAEGDVDVKINGSGGWTNNGLPNGGSTINNFIYTGADNNSYEFRYRAKDNAGNWSGYSYDGSVLVNINDPPTVSCNDTETWSSCVDSRNPALSWNYSDPDSDPQASYQVQIDNNSNFSSPEIDTGIVNSSSKTYQPTGTTLQWGTTYYWHVKVKDSYNNWSGYCSNCSFITPSHAYPNIDFNWAPQKPSAEENVRFSDQSTCYDDVITGSNCTKPNDSYLWNFIGPGTVNYDDPLTPTLEFPVVSFSEPGVWNATLQVTDSTPGNAFKCSTSKPFNVSYPLPEWNEIIPR